MLLLNPGEPLANKRRGLRIRGLAPVGEVFPSFKLSPHSMSSVAPPRTFLHATFRENRQKETEKEHMSSQYNKYANYTRNVQMYADNT